MLSESLLMTPRIQLLSLTPCAGAARPTLTILVHKYTNTDVLDGNGKYININSQIFPVQ